MSSTTDVLGAVSDLARLMGDVALGHYRSTLHVDTKADGSPVTIADRAAEEAGRRWLRQRFPNDDVLGEELGAQSGSSGRRWILDPIDGTINFSRDSPLCTISLSLVIDGQPVSGSLTHHCWASGSSHSRGQGRT